MSAVVREYPDPWNGALRRKAVQTEEPLVLNKSLNGSTARKTLIDADVVAPLFWGDDEQQFARLDAMRRAGL